MENDYFYAKSLRGNLDYENKRQIQTKYKEVDY